MQQGFCKIRATEYRLKDIGNSNRLLYLGRSDKKVTAKRTDGILMPVLRKAPNVACNPIGHNLNMQTEQTQLDKLALFKQRDKFSSSAWNDRGLNSSSNELCQRLTQLFNLCAENLIEAVNNKYSSKQLKTVLKAGLSRFNKFDYDTEEKEFICDLFYELATIINIDFKDNLSKWLYGSTLTTLLKIQKFLKPDKVIETLSQPCSKCDTRLDTYIMKKEKGIPESSWLIAKCNNCGELNLLSHGPDVKETRFGNYQWVENLSMSEYTRDQALTRLEQIKYFRK